MKSLRILAATFVASCLMTAAAFAADPSGSWKWSQAGRQGQQEITAKLVLKDGKLTGSVLQPGRGGGEPMPIDISDASFKGDVVAFSTVRTFGDNKIVTKYEGKLDGDSIKGTIERGAFNGQEATKSDWAATKAKM